MSTTDDLVAHVLAGRLLMADVLDDLHWFEQHRPDVAPRWRAAADRLKEAGYGQAD